MNADEQVLRRLNEELIDAENRGDHAWIAGILAPSFAFQRADESVLDGLGFLQSLAPGGTRTTEIREPIQLFADRAVVEAIVHKDARSYHNLRLWVKLNGEWKLLGWANRQQ